jgi:hypothetical protein
MLVFSHRFTFGLCVSVIALTAIVVVSLTLMFNKQQDNALLHERISILKTENAALRNQVHQLTASQPGTLKPGLAQPADMHSTPASGGQASDS